MKPPIVEPSCGDSLEEHIVDAYMGLTEMGVGMACRESYHALMEIAEEARRQNNLAPYTPVGHGYAERVIQEAVQKAAIEMATTQVLTEDDVLRDDFEFPAGLSRN